MLFTLTSIISFVTMALAVWLGLYVVSRSPRSLVAWLTGLTLWTIARLFIDVLLALTPPPMPANQAHWFQLLFPFWRAMTLKEQGGSGWLQGWSVVTIVMLWHHATTLMRSGPLTPWRWIRILIGYGIVVAWMALNVNTSFFFASTIGDPLYLNTLKAGSLYPIFAAFILLFTGMSVSNLVRSAYTAPTAMPRKQLLTLASATVIGGLTGPLSIAASAFGLPVPVLALSILLGIYVILIGYGVARYSALIDGRALRYDFIYNGTTVGLIILVYLLSTWIIVQAYQLPAAVYVLVIILAIGSHFLIGVAHYALDSLFYRQDTRRLRDELRQLTALAGEQTDQAEYLALALDSMCKSVQATFGLIVLFEGNTLQPAANYRWHQSRLALSPIDLMADDIIPLEPGHFSAPLTEAALLIPLYAEAKQIGAVLLGQPQNGTGYAQADLELLIYPSDWLADTIANVQRKADYLNRIAALLEKDQPPASQYPTQISVKAVENALRHLADFAYLGDHPLAKTKLAKSHFPTENITHLDRGKAVYTILVAAVGKLRPEGQSPAEPPPKEWHAYLILHEAYVGNQLNRDIMSRLYISEGTFNRTRRSALRAVTKTLIEIEGVTNNTTG